MSFVKDDHRYTRGVGAIAATDAVSPRRRIAAARGALVMARRDAVMARSTLGRAPLLTSPATPSFGIRMIEVDPFGRGAGGLKPTTGGGGGGGGGLKPIAPMVMRPPVRTVPGQVPLVPRKETAVTGLIKGGGVMVKSPGSVIAPMVATTPTATVVVTPPPKATTTIIAGGGVPWTGGGASSPPAPLPIPEMPSMEPLPEATEAKPKSSNLLLYAALGIGALWLLSESE